MNTHETKAVLTIALMAAFADGMKDERERAEFKRVAEALGSGEGADLPALYREVLLAKPDLAQVAAALQSQEVRQFAYEMAVGVCEADGSRGPAESEFLGKLGAALNLPVAVTGKVNTTADDLASATDAAGSSESADTAASATDAGPVVTGAVLGKSSLPAADMDTMVLNAAITNAALELLPESLSSMAIIPLQIRLVYRIGKSYGYAMDRTHARDFLATLGVGLTGQYVEQIGRKMLGGLLGTLGGGLGRSLGRQAASSGMTFATTYALGRVAQRYYAGGRTLDTAALKETFTSLLAEARGLAPRYQADIERKAGTIDTASLASLIKQV